MAQPKTMLDGLIDDNQEHLNEVGLSVLRYAFHEVAHHSISSAQEQKHSLEFVFSVMTQRSDLISLEKSQSERAYPIKQTIKSHHKCVTVPDDLKAVGDALERARLVFERANKSLDLSSVNIPQKSYQYAALVAEELKKDSFFTKAP